jgi:predicted transcriptional regulator
MEFTADSKRAEIKVKTDAQLKPELIALYELYIENPENPEVYNKSFEIYQDYSGGADTIFSKSISTAIWGAFYVLKKKLTKQEALDILNDLKESKVNLENKLTKEEATALYYCDDSIGLTVLLAKYLDISMERVPKLMEKLLSNGLVTSSPDDKVKGQFWYETTEKGKQSLKDFKGKLDV